MTAGAAFRGQPLLLLGAILGAWLVLRLALWEAPFLPRLEPGGRVEARELSAAVQPRQKWPPVPSLPALPRATDPLPRLFPWLPAGLGPAFLAQPSQAVPAGTQALQQQAPGLATMSPPRAAVPVVPAVPVAALAPSILSQSPTTQPLGGAAPAGLSRWSGDAWALLRRDTAVPAAAGRPSYGRSQAGAALRYRLAPTSPHRPEAYGRGSVALAGAREQELAVGVSARPLSGVPLRLAVEARLHETERGGELRPAVFAVSELPPIQLPLGLTGEAYLQGGYVGGRFANAFIDGQARLDRAVLQLRGTELTAGAGLWGGAQEGAARLDAGPTVALSIPLGAVRARLSADYRLRLAGDAAPASGPALTVSAGF